MDQLYLLPEDEMEFMPIIPLSEDGNENTDEQDIPAEVPLLPLRNTVLFPGVVLRMTFGRNTRLNAGDNDFAAMVSSIKELAAQIIQLSPNIPAEASIILKNIENPAFLIHFVSSNLNSTVPEKQKLLEINDIKSRAEVLMNLLQTELQY